MVWLVIYLIGFVALQVVEALDDEAKGVFIVLALVWPLFVVCAILMSPFIITTVVRKALEK